MHVADSLFKALWGLQQADGGWLSSRIRANAITQISRAARIARSHLLELLPGNDPVATAWQKRQAGRIAAALSDKQTWLVTPKPDSREALYEKLGPAIVSLLVGAWDDLELINETGYDGQAAPRLEFATIAMGILRTGLIAALPMVLYALAKSFGLLAGIDAIARGWLKIGLFVWAALTVMLGLDPQLKDKIALLKDATAILIPGGDKEEKGS